MNIAIIGGGASGLAAAIVAGRAGAGVTIIEHTDKLGKKLLSTGNGKCNYTNANLQAKHFHLEEEDLAYFVVKGIGYDGINAFFEELGIEAFVRDGYTYPKSEQAASIRDALILEVERLGVKVYRNTRIQKILPVQKAFRLDGEISDPKGTACRYSKTFDKVILATGSKAFSVSGSDGSGIDLLRPFQIRTKPFLPALCAVHVDEKAFFKAAGGVRVKARLHLLIDGVERACEDGELQITDYGLSGIPVFQLSRHASIALYEKKTVDIRVDILPEYSDKEQYLEARMNKTHLRSAGDFGLGLVNKKLWTALLQRAKIRDDLLVNQGSNLSILASALDSLQFRVSKCADTEKSQICTGGIALEEMDFHTLELKKARGIYVIGELADIDGICGGYNLTWAWCSGMFAARNAVRRD